VAPVLESTGGFEVEHPTVVRKNKHNTKKTRTKLLIFALIVICINYKYEIETILLLKNYN